MRLLIALAALLALALTACSGEAETEAPARSTLASRTPTPASRTPTPASSRTGVGTASVAPDTASAPGTPGSAATEPPVIGPTDTATPMATGSTPNAGGSSGINGIALAGPQCPVERLDSPCPDRPVANAEIDIYSGDRTTKVTTATTDADGRFRVDLPPGDYYLAPQPPDASRPFPVGAPQTVTVQPGEYTDVTVSYDTGIR